MRNGGEENHKQEAPAWFTLDMKNNKEPGQTKHPATWRILSVTCVRFYIRSTRGDTTEKNIFWKKIKKGQNTTMERT